MTKTYKIIRHTNQNKLSAEDQCW